MTGKNKVFGLLAVLLIVALACNAPTSAFQPTEAPITQPSGVEDLGSSSEPVAVTHLQTPSTNVPIGTNIKDVESSGTGPEKRAPYGDSYDINLLERPFLQDMTYIPDLDIESFNLGQDNDWHYVSIKLIGPDPNNTIGIHFAVELDNDKDGFGDFVIWAKPSYTNEWTTANVQVFADQNQDTSGLAANKSDAPFSSDGYETLIFDGAQAVGDDPDLAWVRTGNDGQATIQFAFKRSWAGDVFLAGVIADAGLKDAAQLDYVDRFTEADAGSSVKDKKYYPVQALYSVDNTCRQAVGFASTGYEPMSCVKNAPPEPGGGGSGSSDSSSSGDGCSMKPSDCDAGAPYYWPFPHCACSATPY